MSASYSARSRWVSASRSSAVVQRRQPVVVDGVDGRLGAHHRDLGRGQRQRRVRLEARARPSRTARPRRPSGRSRRSSGTVASDTALIILAPCRMMPCRSTAVPTMKPGTSARNSSGTLKASQSWMKRVALSAESTNSTPPLNIGLLATTPIGWPSSRAKPTTSSRAHSAWISNSESSSTMPAHVPAHVEGLPLADRHHGPQVGRLRARGRGGRRRQLPVAGQVGQVGADRADRLGLGRGQEVADARHRASASGRRPSPPAWSAR